MIYLDNSATTFPKPLPVRRAVSSAMQMAANPGRGGHQMALKASEEIFLARKKTAELFGCDKLENVVFTLNCTAALNTVIHGILRSGDHAVVSSLEHNAVMRPLEKLREKGVSYTVAEVFPCDNDKTVDSFRKAINAHTKLVVCTHASNVWGIRLPIERLAALCHEYGILFAVDAAQTAGVVPIDVKCGIDFLCTAGHKGLYGPMGTGVLVVSGDSLPDTLMQGGTGSNSMSYEQPEELPDRFESGTPNYSGIVGLRAGIDFVSSKTPEKIAVHEHALIQYLYRELSKRDNIILYTPEPTKEYFVPILSFNVRDKDSETVSAYLNKRGIAVRAGLHCSPAAHQMMGTLSTGAVRVSPSTFTRMSDIEQFLAVIRNA